MTNKKETAFPLRAGTLGKAAAINEIDYSPDASIRQDKTPNLSGLTHQILILLGWLKYEHKIDTLVARRRGINHPAGRINDLRNRGVQIETQWTNGVLQTGKTVKVALYVLKHNPQLSLFDLLESSSRKEGGR